MKLRDMLQESSRERLITKSGSESVGDLNWEGCGAVLKVTKLRGDAFFHVFLLNNVALPNVIDNPQTKRPFVIRSIPRHAPDTVTDRVCYPDDPADVRTFVEYHHPKHIIKPYEFFRGGWPLPEAYLNPHASELLCTMGEVVLEGAGAVREGVGLGGDQSTFENIAPIDLAEAGTGPYYRVSS